MAFFSTALSIILLIIGFGFVIFWHELGHFLAAKWVGIRVEQFAVGMGHAVVSYRKGIGLKLGNSRKQYESRAKAHLDKAGGRGEYTEAQINKAADEIGLGQTEYRLSWLPLGGYVKMLGQDDMSPGSKSEDPGSYNVKSVGARMLVISAGVIMNIILAGILFMILFMYGFKAPSAVVGNVIAGAPAQQDGNGLRPGDRIIAFDGQIQHDFTKVSLNTALASPNEPLNVEVERWDTGKRDFIKIQPIRLSNSAKAFLALGVAPAHSMSGVKAADFPEEPKHPDLERKGARDIRPGDVITEINGHPVLQKSPTDVDAGMKDWGLFDRELQAARGKPLKVTVRRANGTVEPVYLESRFTEPFGADKSFSIAGFLPRVRVEAIANPKSPVFEKIRPGDVVASVAVRAANAPADAQGDRESKLSRPRFIELMNDAGQKGQTLDFTLLRDGKPVQVKNITPNLNIGEGRRGIGVAPGLDEDNAVVADVQKNSPAERVKGGIPPGAQVTAIEGKPMKTWHDVRAALTEGGEGDFALTLTLEDGSTINRTLTLAKSDLTELRNIRLDAVVATLGELSTIRQTSSPLIALGWGVTETRDLILQFYVTLKRMFGDRTVSPSNLMGPLGIGHAGFKLSSKGTDWLIWFLAMISANLAVVNFLPIPVVDGGHFVFLLIEKLRGKPVPAAIQEFALKFGLILLLGVFLFVTYNDIARFFGR